MVADTNIHIPAVLFGGKPEKIRELARERKDEPDNRILECAIEAKAGYIISGDEHHLQPLKEFQGMKILSPARFPNLIRAGVK